jgi:hypothetical protein
MFLLFKNNESEKTADFILNTLVGVNPRSNIPLRVVRSILDKHDDTNTFCDWFAGRAQSTFHRYRECSIKPSIRVCFKILKFLDNVFLLKTSSI